MSKSMRSSSVSFIYGSRFYRQSAYYRTQHGLNSKGGDSLIFASMAMATAAYPVDSSYGAVKLSLVLIEKDISRLVTIFYDLCLCVPTH